MKNLKLFLRYTLYALFLLNLWTLNGMSEESPPEMKVHISGKGVTLYPATQEQIELLQGTDERDRNVIAVLLQDMEGKVAQNQFVFESKVLDKLTHGSMFVVTLLGKKYADVLGLQLGIVSGFENYSINTIGISLNDALTSPTEIAVFGFGLLRL
jgi:hypothetical protein